MKSDDLIKVEVKKNPFYMSHIDIIIPFHNQHNKVSKLLESIFGTVRSNKYKINLVDDASVNTFFIERLKKVKGISSFRNNEERGFGASVNLAIKNSKQPFILIMKPEVVVRGSNWLSKLGESLFLMQEKKVMMVSPLINDPKVDSRFFAEKYDLREDNLIISDGYLPMYCVLFPRNLLNSIGLFKENGNEIEEFSLRMKGAGYRQAICGQSWVEKF